jgi:hypothetical protein
MKRQSRELTPAREILLNLFGGEEKLVAEALLRHTYFIHPRRIRERREQTGSAAWFPNHVRMSNEYHPGARRKGRSSWEGREVVVCDNNQARRVFGAFTGLVMSGNQEGRIRGYHVAHIWERVYDPDCFTAGWNMCLMPGFLKLFTEQQDRIELLHQVVQQAAFDLYFKDGTIGLPTPVYVSNPGLDLIGEFPGIRLSLL